MSYQQHMKALRAEENKDKNMRYANEVWGEFISQYPEYNFESARHMIADTLRDQGLQFESCNAFDLLAAAQACVVPLVIEKVDTTPPTRQQVIELIVGLLRKY